MYIISTYFEVLTFRLLAEIVFLSEFRYQSARNAVVVPGFAYEHHVTYYVLHPELWAYICIIVLQIWI